MNTITKKLRVPAMVLAALSMSVVLAFSAFAASSSSCPAGDCGSLGGALTSGGGYASTVAQNPNYRQVGVLANITNAGGATIRTSGQRYTTGRVISGSLSTANAYAMFGAHTVNSVGAGFNTYTRIG